ncbi:MAG: hypothetical protein GVY04_11960 [Cyanobacteria bacterium]|jgi:nucleoid DNA-binding protein|nr:hypothetical protein [Cyanobacteria bacterium GSL.Bin1]
MKKTDLIKELSNQSNLPQTETKLAIDTLESLLSERLQENDEKIKLGIGYFYKTASGQPRFSPSPKFTKQVKGEDTQPPTPNQQDSNTTKGVKKKCT